MQKFPYFYIFYIIYIVIDEVINKPKIKYNSSSFVWLFIQHLHSVLEMLYSAHALGMLGWNFVKKMLKWLISYNHNITSVYSILIANSKIINIQHIMIFLLLIPMVSAVSVFNIEYFIGYINWHQSRCSSISNQVEYYTRIVSTIPTVTNYSPNGSLQMCTSYNKQTWQ